MGLDRTPYEFSPETKLEALRRTDFCCADCGTPKRETERGYLEIHHRIPIWAFHYNPELFVGVTADILTSVENARPLCHPCHREKDRLQLETYARIAQAILGGLMEQKELPGFADV